MNPPISTSDKLSAGEPASLILGTTTRFLQPLLLLFSVFLLLRGHNEPGGGFTGGLFAGSSFILYAIAYDVERARRVLVINPGILIAAGLVLAAGSGVFAMFVGDPYLGAVWLFVPTGMGLLELGTPLVFDVGVYLVVLGTAVIIIFSLLEE